MNYEEQIKSLEKGATKAPIDPLVESTLPRVRSTSLITMPGDAKFRGILLLSESLDYY